jgi:hypothetical protein
VNDKPKNWIITHDGRTYPINGYADPLEAVRYWATDFDLDGETVVICEVINPLKVDIRMIVHTDYR